MFELAWKLPQCFIPIYVSRYSCWAIVIVTASITFQAALGDFHIISLPHTNPTNEALLLHSTHEETKCIEVTGFMKSLK